MHFLRGSCLLLAVFIAGSNAGFNQVDSNWIHVSGTSSKQALTGSSLCYQTNAAATTFTAVHRFFENDDALNEVDPDDSTTKKIEYATCHYLDADEWISNNKRKKLTTSGCSFGRVDTGTPVGTQIDRRTFESTLTVSKGGNQNTDITCGRKLTGNENVWIVRCQRYAGYDFALDAIFRINCDLDTDLLTVTQETDIKGLVPKGVAIDNGWKVSLNIYKRVTNGFSSVGPKADPNDASIEAVTGPVTLGYPLFYDLCLELDQPFFQNGFTPIGVYARSCVASRVDPLNADTNDPSDPSDETVVGTDGCGTTSTLYRSFKTSDYVFVYVNSDGDPNTADDNLRSPNCFRTKAFEAAAYQALMKNGVSGIKLTCQVKFCTSITDPRCFPGNGNCASGQPGATGRRRREEEEEDGDDEVTLSAVHMVDTRLPPYKEAQTEEEACFETTPFIALTSALSLLLLVVLGIAAFLFVRVRSLSNDDKESSESGFTNKGYY